MDTKQLMKNLEDLNIDVQISNQNVRVFFDSGNSHEWNYPSHTVNVYNKEGNNIDCYSIGSSANDHATFSDFFRILKRDYIAR